MRQENRIRTSEANGRKNKPKETTPFSMALGSRSERKDSTKCEKTVISCRATEPRKSRESD